MFKFINTYRLQISIAVAILGLFLLLFQSYNEQGSSRIQMVIQTVTYPFQASVQSVASNIKNLWNSYILLIDVKEENNRLKQQLLDMEEKLSEHIENSVQFRRLRDQMLFARKNPLEKIYAEIIGESSDNTHNIRFINRGSNQKVQRNYIVIRKEGLVGRIHSVSPFQSSVQLMIDPVSYTHLTLPTNREV